MSDAKRMHPSRPGFSAVGFALGLPIALAGLSGAVEYGHYAYQRVVVARAVEAAVRTGASRPQDWSPGPQETAQRAAHDALADHAWASGVALEVTLVGDAPEQLVSLTATIPYTPLVGLVPTPATVGTSYGMRLTDQP